MPISQALKTAQAQGLQRLDAQMLLLHALQRSPHDRAWLMAHGEDALAPADAQRFHTLQRRRADGEPMAYILGAQAFFGLTLQVDPRVLVPRPDTETLVQWALDLTGSLPDRANVLDLGTGSGAIALALKSQRPGWHITATDCSADALTVAEGNAQRLGLDVRFKQGNWLDAVAGARFDLIVSNPPYIAEGDPHLPPLHHEPISALTAGADGLRDIMRIVQGASGYLSTGAWLLLEHGHDQALAVRELLQQARFTQVHSRCDLAGIERCTGGRWSIPG